MKIAIIVIAVALIVVCAICAALAHGLFKLSRMLNRTSCDIEVICDAIEEAEEEMDAICDVLNEHNNEINKIKGKLK